MREHLDPDDPHHRLYLPGRRWMAQRTLSRTIPALLPTPRTNEATGVFPHDRPESMDNLATRISRLPNVEGEQGAEDDVTEDGVKLLPTPSAWLGRRPENATADPERMASRKHEGTRGKRSLELPEALAMAGVIDKLLPTPTAGDAKAAGSRNLEGSKAHPGVSLTDAIQTGDSNTPRRLLPTPTAEDGERGRHGSGSDRLGHSTFVEGDVRLLPTPQAADGDGGRQEKGAMSAGGRRPSGQKATLPLPTAVSMREEIAERPFAAVDEGEQAALFDVAAAGDALLPTPVANPDNPGAGGELRAAVVHGAGRRNETGIDTFGRPNRGRSTGLLPTPTTQDGENTAGPSQLERNSDALNVVAAKSEVSWGVYESAIRRWEAIFGRIAPPPTDEKGRLDSAFVEWMLGYPEGWFELPGLKRTAKLRALGNSVQVQCGEAVGYWARDLIESGLLFAGCET